MIRTYRSFIGICALFLLLFSGCSSERKNVLSKTYHNTTARYNAIFYAKNRVAEIEEIIEEAHDDNYDRILRVYPYYDSVLATNYKEQVEDAIVKASLAIERHKNSKWVDDGYLLVGIARMYDTDYVNAIETFKYVYKNGDDLERVIALAYLMRSYTDYEEYRNALEVSDYIEKEKLKKDEAKIVYINRAYLYQMTGDLDKMVQNLVKAGPLLTRKDGKGRMYFIIGQIYESLGFESEAYGYFRQCIASNPKYELDFHARIRMAQVAELNGASDVKSTRKLFAKLLKDKKNTQFIDKIYYEMGEFEAKQGNLDAAILNYKEALQASTQPNRQKALSYLRLGQIHFDSLKKYSLAKDYYDSTIQILPEDFENYDKISKRQEVLADFVEQINTIELQDSLLVLASKDSVQTRFMIKDMLSVQDSIQQQKEEEIEEKQQRATRRSNYIVGDKTGFSSTNWYFDNATAIAQGQSEFRRIWGDRSLEDHWRRSNKQIFRNYDEQAAIQEEEVADVEMQDPEAVAAAIEARLNQRTDVLMKTIPYTQAAQDSSKKAIENAYYRLGNIYYFDLEVEANATENFEILLERFPMSEYVPEVLYQLILIYRDSNPDKAAIYEQRLVNDFPNSTYARLIANPNYTLENSQVNEQLKKAYAQVYVLYAKGEYAFALSRADSALSAMAVSSFTPNLELLKILILGKNDPQGMYESRLETFIEKYPDDDITSYAEELLRKSEEFDEGGMVRAINYSESHNQEHYFVIAFSSDEGNNEKVLETIKLHNTLNWDQQQLKQTRMSFDEGRQLVLVRRFENGREAYRYLKDFQKNKVIGSNMLNGKSDTFVITKDNFDILYQSRDLPAYLEFFEKNYRNGIYEQGQ